VQINVLTELRQPLGSVSVFDIQESSATLGETQLDGLTGTLKLLRTDRGLLASLHAQATLQESCSRCLKDVPQAIDVDFEEEYMPVVDAETGARLYGGGTADQFWIGPDFVLDLREGLRQYVLMSEPAKPLCRPDCRGLCPGCGVDLTVGSCACEPHRDSRWEVLAGLGLNDTEGS
jgi:uncharacterized protein